MELIGYYLVTGVEEGRETAERTQKAFLWHLHWLKVRPGDPDDSDKIAAMLKLTPEQERLAREKFMTWNPADEPPPEPKSCPGRPFSF